MTEVPPNDESAETSYDEAKIEQKRLKALSRATGLQEFTVWNAAAMVVSGNLLIWAGVKIAQITEENPVGDIAGAVTGGAGAALTFFTLGYSVAAYLEQLGNDKYPKQ